MVTERIMDLLRHGEVQGGACFRGEQDDPLSALGWEQMRLATTAERGWTRIISSPSLRCAEFARGLAADLDLAMEERAAFRERGFGAWEGLSADQIPSEALTEFWTDPVNYTPPEAEPFADFQARVLDGWRQMINETDRHSLLVSHGGVIRVLMSTLLQMPADAILRLEVPYACLTRMRIPEPPWHPSLVFHRPLA